MIPLEHPWEKWQEYDDKSNDLYAWKWKATILTYYNPTE